MLRVGLTGNIGSGKTLAARIFESLGIEVFYADLVAGMLLQDDDVKSAIIHAFGDQILDGKDQIVNQRLAAIVFSHPPSLNALNTIIHPVVREKFLQWIDQKKSSAIFVILEAAILFESGFNRECDKVITVSAPESLRIERVMQRDHVTREEVLLRMKNQWDNNKKVKMADFVINNDGQQLVIPQILAIHHKLMNTFSSSNSNTK